MYIVWSYWDRKKEWVKAQSAFPTYKLGCFFATLEKKMEQNVVWDVFCIWRQQGVLGRTMDRVRVSRYSVVSLLSIICSVRLDDVSISSPSPECCDNTGSQSLREHFEKSKSFRRMCQVLFWTWIQFEFCFIFINNSVGL